MTRSYWADEPLCCAQPPRTGPFHRRLRTPVRHSISWPETCFRDTSAAARGFLWEQEFRGQTALKGCHDCTPGKLCARRLDLQSRGLQNQSLGVGHVADQGRGTERFPCIFLG